MADTTRVRLVLLRRHSPHLANPDWLAACGGLQDEPLAWPKGTGKIPLGPFKEVGASLSERPGRHIGLRTFVAVCREEHVWPGGVHLEFTREDVTECIGGSHEVLEDQLGIRYMTLCDPRLNARQSLDLAFQISELLRDRPGTPVT